VGDNWSFKATGGTFIRYPNFYELFGDGLYLRPALFFASAVPLPIPEAGEQWDFTVEWRGELPWLETPANISATYFTRRTNNMIGLYQTAWYVYYGNYGEHKASGVEFEGGVKSTYANLSFSGTWLESEVIHTMDVLRTSAISAAFAEGMEILNSPQWETNLRLDLRVPMVNGLSVFAEHHYTDKVPIVYNPDPENSIRYEEELQRVNLGLRAEAFGLTLTAGVNDVFDAATRQGYFDTISAMKSAQGRTSNLFFPKEGRSFYGTVEYEF
jgi:hypothetical protein